MLRLYRKTICRRWHLNRKKCSEKKNNQNAIQPKSLVLYPASQKENNYDQNHQKKQHADKQDKQYWDNPYFHFNFFRTSVFETAGWLGTAALCLSYHLRHVSSAFEYEKKNSCIFSNIVLAMPRCSSQKEKPFPSVPQSLLPIPAVQNQEKDTISRDFDILEGIKNLIDQYTAAVENSVGVKSINSDDKKAFRSFQSAACHGSSSGYYNLGLCYQLGKGTRVNLNRAAFCYKKAALKGHGLASFNLAVFYSKGIGGLPVDMKIAKELLSEAAEKDVPEAQLYFGILFLEEKKWQEAVRIFVKLTEKNSPEAQCYLGLCYENGLGVEKNEKVALELYEKSAAQGNERAHQKLRNYQESIKQSFVKSAKFERSEHNSHLHVSASVPEISALVSKSDQSIANFPLLSYLNLCTPFLFVEHNSSRTRDNLFTDQKKLAREYSNTFLPLRIPLVVMQVKTQL